MPARVGIGIAAVSLDSVIPGCQKSATVGSLRSPSPPLFLFLSLCLSLSFSLSLPCVPTTPPRGCCSRPITDSGPETGGKPIYAEMLGHVGFPTVRDPAPMLFGMSWVQTAVINTLVSNSRTPPQLPTLTLSHSLRARAHTHRHPPPLHPQGTTPNSLVRLPC